MTRKLTIIAGTYQDAVEYANRMGIPRKKWRFLKNANNLAEQLSSSNGILYVPGYHVRDDSAQAQRLVMKNEIALAMTR